MKKIINFIKRLLKISNNNEQKKNEASKLNNLYQQSQHYSDKPIILSNHEIQLLIEKAEFYLKEKKYHQALLILDQLINSKNPHPSYYHSRAVVYGRLAEFEKAIDDENAAIQMNPDNANYYWNLGGYLLSNEMLLHGKIAVSISKKVFEDVANNYRISLRKDPANEYTWLNSIEISLFTNNWDDAICQYGSCQPYVHSLEYKLIRSFLGSLALIFSEEEINDVDVKILKDVSIRISNDNYRVCEVESFISELEASGFYLDRIIKAKEIYKLFIAHYDEEPHRYGL